MRLIAKPIHGTHKIGCFTINTIKNDGVHICVAQADKLRRHVLISDVVGFLTRQGQPGCTHGIGHVGHCALAPGSAFKHQANAPGAAACTRRLNKERRNPTILHGNAKHPFIAPIRVFNHLGAGGNHAHPGQAHFIQRLAQRNGVWGAEAAHHDDAIIAFAYAPRIIHGTRRLTLVIIRHQPQPLPKHTTGGIDFVNRCFYGVTDLQASMRQRPGQFPGGADAGFGALRLRGCAQPEQGQASQQAGPQKPRATPRGRRVLHQSHKAISRS